MAEGMRDAFIESDSSTFGNYDLGTNLMGSSASRAPRKRNKKSKTRVHRTHKKRHKKSKKTMIHKKSRGGIHYTKKGQPYKIMPNGRARFIKK
jgi:hypothetical protein